MFNCDYWIIISGFTSRKCFIQAQKHWKSNFHDTVDRPF